MNSSQKISFKIPALLAFFAAIFLIYSSVVFVKHRDQISFHEKLKNNDQINFENYVNRATTILKSNDALKASIVKEKRSIASDQSNADQYNKIASEYNRLSHEINSDPFLNSHPELKKAFIEVNNQAFKFLESTHNLLSNKTTSAGADSSTFLGKYESLKQHDAVTEFGFYSLNKSTFLFSIGLLGCILCSLLCIWAFSLKNLQLRNFLVQKESELKTFLSIIDNMSEGVVVSDRFGFFNYYNQSALEIIGKNVKDLYYQSSFDLIGFHDTDGNKLTKAESPFHKAVKKDVVTDQEILVKNEIHPDGIYISASNGFFVDEKGDTLGAVVVMKNISHKKQLEELWKKEKQVAIEGSQKKSDFLASMSHEIRTPMNGIIGLTTLLSETKLDDQQNEFVSIIRRSAYSLLALINDILDHSKIESGKIELVQNNFDIQFLIKDVIENFRMSCAEKNNQMTFEFAPGIKDFYLADENRIRQILMNLVGNAAKFTSNGHILIKLDLLKDDNTESSLRFSVTDTGPGMDQQELDRLFQRFFQTKTGIKFGGTGLGLSICKQLVDLMKGKIGVYSAPGQGSTFWFELNLQKGTNVENKKNVKLSDFNNSFAGHVLVAEDNSINQKVIHQYLTKLGFTIDIANNGAEAVDLFQKNKYDIILMDCNMPVLNGYQATQKINELQIDVPENEKIKIVALTAEGQVTGMAKCLEAGMCDFINKPILIDEFVTVLKKYCTKLEGSFDKSRLHKLKELTVGNDLLMEVLFEEYKTTTPDIIKDLNQFATDKKFKDLSDLAHSLKSASGTLGAQKVQALCQALEDEKNNPTPLLLELETEYHNSLVEIEKEIQLIKKSNKAAA